MKRDTGFAVSGRSLPRISSTRVLNGTGNLAAVMKTMGHKDVKTAMQYQHPELEMVRTALNRTATEA